MVRLMNQRCSLGEDGSAILAPCRRAKGDTVPGELGMKSPKRLFYGRGPWASCSLETQINAQRPCLNGPRLAKLVPSNHNSCPSPSISIFNIHCYLQFIIVHLTTFGIRHGIPSMYANYRLNLLQIPSSHLLSLNRFKQRLEVACPKP